MRFRLILNLLWMGIEIAELRSELIYRKLKIMLINRKRIKFEKLESSWQGERAKIFLAAEGGVVGLWRELEITLDLWIDIAHKHEGGKLVQSKLPKALDEKLKYLAKYLDRKPLNKSVKLEGLKIIKMLHRRKTFRHSVVHGRIDISTTRSVIIETRNIKDGRRMSSKTTYSDMQFMTGIIAFGLFSSHVQSYVENFEQAVLNFGDQK